MFPSPGNPFDVTADVAASAKLAEQEAEAGYANATVNHRLQTFSSAITLARKRGFKVPDLTIPKLKTTKGRTRVLTDEEFESIKVQLRDMTIFKSDQYRATPQAAFRQDAADIVELLSGTGARRAEVTTLEWPQINLKTKTIHLYRSKTDNEMVFHMTDDAFEVLVRRSENRRHPLYVFPNRKGMRLLGHLEVRSRRPSSVLGSARKSRRTSFGTRWRRGY